jgi:hypothetical protein
MSSGLRFRWLWRANAVLIFLCGVGVLLLLAILAVTIATETFTEPRGPRQIINAEAVGAARAQLGEFEAVRGTSIFRAALSSNSPSYSFASKGDSGATINYLYFDPVTGATRWLFPDGHRLIQQQEWWPESQYDNDGPEPQAIVYSLAEARPSSQGAEPPEGRVAIVVSDPAGRIVTNVAATADRLMGVAAGANGQLDILYLTDGELRVASVLPPTLELKGERVVAIPTVPKTGQTAK